MDKNASIYVAGHRGLVGSALVRALESQGFGRIVRRTSQELDLRDAQAVRELFEREEIDYVFLAAAKVGGIVANNDYPAEFIRDNLLIQTNVIDAAHRAGVRKLLFLGSTCIYPKMAPQPLREEYLLTGTLEPTNEPYAIAKIAGIKMCQAYNRQYGTRFIPVMPTNLYGPNDNYDPDTSHVLPALIRKFHEAKLLSLPYVTLWGTGTPRREFLHADDLADACLFLMDSYEDDEIVNIGWGRDISIAELAERIKEIVGYGGEIRYDPQRPDGTPRKLVDVSKLEALGWKARIPLEQGLKDTYEWYLQQSAGVPELIGLQGRQG
ncbi:NAD-dependent epimerase/dehydratase family protein [Cohnella sp. CFH 77786]|uniref:GDP-L-fucose synthase n=1 Tax=Cohnella sp. CFH 77786 TaxID=2662265 RepID=UPI001C60B148|nr:GDP-L-fucose synthase [Cohnella sp. CFH 77786]MBW5448367.1 NAD-dependent epimerase/dehydratase family protein [Cohnella sp. CFH 77786]